MRRRKPYIRFPELTGGTGRALRNARYTFPAPLG